MAKANSKYFVTLDMTSGYHQIGIDEESSKLLVIVTSSRRYKIKVIDQGITSASNIFNLLTDGDTRFDENTLNNMDNLMIFADSLPHLKEKVEEFLMFAQKKNLKLKTSKFPISKEGWWCQQNWYRERMWSISCQNMGGLRHSRT